MVDEIAIEMVVDTDRIQYTCVAKRKDPKRCESMKEKLDSESKDIRTEHEDRKVDREKEGANPPQQDKTLK